MVIIYLNLLLLNHYGSCNFNFTISNRSSAVLDIILSSEFTINNLLNLFEVFARHLNVIESTLFYRSSFPSIVASFIFSTPSYSSRRHQRSSFLSSLYFSSHQCILNYNGLTQSSKPRRHINSISSTVLPSTINDLCEFLSVFNNFIIFVLFLHLNLKRQTIFIQISAQFVFNSNLVFIYYNLLLSNITSC